MTTFRIVIEVIASVLLVLLILEVGSLLSEITEYMKAKTTNVELGMTNDLSSMINDVTSFLKLVDAMILNETQNVFREYISTKNEYNLQKLDDDSKVIAQKVFNGVDNDIILRVNDVITSEYVMTYIINKSIDSILLTHDELKNYIRTI